MGPKCHQLGFSANDSFTIVFTMKFDQFSTILPTSPIEILKMYANTLGTNGISLTINNDYVISNENVKVNMSFGFGSYIIPVTGLTNINTSYIYMFVISKNGLSVNLSMYPNIAELASNPQQKTTIAALALVDTDDVLLSNREMKINGSTNLQAHIYNFGIWNKFINDGVLAQLFATTKNEIQSNNETLKTLTNQINTLQEQLNNVGSCPYGSSVCTACRNVNNWNDMSDIILNAGPECMDKINTYCKNNQNAAMCTCWNKSNALSGTASCQTYTSIFGNALNPVPVSTAGTSASNQCINLDTIDQNTLDQIKYKYNLTNQPTQPVQVSLVESEYVFSSSDIDLYNQITVGPSVQNIPVKTDLYSKVNWF
jgi:hypothetical protein